MNLHNNKRDKPGIIFSLDFELGWGAVENGKWKTREQKGVYGRLRKVIPELLESFSSLDINSSWGIVGAMNEAPGIQELDHLPESFRRRRKRALKEGQEDTFDGRDLLDLLASHEGHISLCCHTYSHTPLHEFKKNEALFEKEMHLFEKATANLPIEKKMIFPRNIEGFCGELEKFGYVKVRGAGVNPGRKRFYTKIKNNVLKSPPASRSKKIGKILIRQTGSLAFNARGTLWRRKLLNLMTRRGLRKIVNKNQILHVYNHPFNMAEDQKLYRDYKNLLHKTALMRDRGLLNIYRF